MNTYVPAIFVISVIVMQGLRFAPFLLWGSNRKAPEFILWLGNVLPYAVMGMLVVYCLKDISYASTVDWAPAVISVLLVGGLQAWRKSSLLSIIAGTACYMVLIQIM